MKVNFEIDASPEEWRRFFGMPDVSSFHEELINQMKEKMASGEAGYDPASLMKQFMPENMQQFANLQQNFWENMFKTNNK
ncbi:DUF6489 family protein [Pleionea sp. CnH1-48]|uniref:DUF6489 family protein n=1 Tax=Pleionea sp. CnH1-48 TaxID=2954494 RepID=UPI0020978B16|nr:DUF6489 family protein [Pleionea sp. CnH1-48]MCO7227073.1 DUF6489 family protein [Pleionea sp. CnH1-48]